MQFYIPVNISNPITNMSHLTVKIVSIWTIYDMFTKTRVLSSNTWINKEHVSVGSGLCLNYWWFSSVQFSRSIVSNFLRPHKLKHSRPPYPSPTARVYPNACPWSRWCHPTISSSAVPFSSCPQSFPASGSFPMSQLFASGGQKYWSFSFNINLSNEHPGLISFRMEWLDLLAVTGTLKSLLQHHSSKASIFWHSASCQGISVF